MRKEIVRTMGFDDQVVFDMLMRHLSRCFAAEDLQLEELGWLFGVLADARPDRVDDRYAGPVC